MGIFIQIVNYTLAVFMWLIIGRMLLSFFLGKRENFMVNFFIKFTEPVYNITRKVVPFATDRSVPFFSILIIFIIRIMLIIIFKPPHIK